MGRKVRDVVPAFAHLWSMRGSCCGWGLCGVAEVHHEERGDDGEVAEAVDEEAEAFA